MQVTLIKPPQIIVRSELWYPLGLLSIASYLQAHGHDIELIDLDIQKSIKEIDGILGVSFDGNTDEKFLEILQKNKSKGNLIIAGGFEATFHYSELLDHELVDIVVLGEGELTIIELVDNIEKNEEWRTVEGIAYKSEDGIKVNRRKKYCDLEPLPLPDRELIDMEKYQVTNPCVNVITSRGCPNKGQCGFCGKTQHTYRVQSVGKTIKEMQFLYDHGYRRFLFGDDYLISSKEYITELCTAIKKHFPDIRWSCLIHVNDCDDFITKIMKEAGCIQIGLGVESFNQKTLDAIRKHFTIPQLKDVMRIFKKNGMHTYFNLIIGLPAESPRLFLANLIKYSFILKPGMINLSLLKASHSLSLENIPGFGSPIQRNPEKFGIHFRDGNDVYCGIPIKIREVDSIGDIKFSSFQKGFRFAKAYCWFWNKIINLNLIDRLLGMTGVVLRKYSPRLFLSLLKIKNKLGLK